MENMTAPDHGHLDLADPAVVLRHMQHHLVAPANFQRGAGDQAQAAQRDVAGIAKRRTLQAFGDLDA
tara:strand:- start:69 stop:269 length:201 start_codon:yes stop_codon:yes gene_type:complete